MQKNKIFIDKEKEITDYPYWIIIDPKQNFRKDIDGVYNIASMITGIWFSRESAEKYLKEKSHHFSKNAVVFCMSGCYSSDYKDAINNAKIEKDKI